MTVRTFGPQTFQIAPRNAGDVQVFLVNGYVPDVEGTLATLSTPVAVDPTTHAVTFAANDGGNAKFTLVLVLTNATGEKQTVRVVNGTGTTLITQGV